MAQVPTQSLQVPMRVREDGREERTAPVLVSVSIETDRESASRRQLMVFQLTDETDPFFLYSLRITEEEFQTLKVDQSILVDFAEFPAKFTELLHHCVEHEGEEMPRFSVALSATPAQAFLSIVETNQFKNLTHLKLEMRAGNDGAVKRYLAGELSKAKGQRDALATQLREQTAALQQSLQAANAALQEAQAKEVRAVADLSTCKIEHAAACADLRQQAANLQQELQSRNDVDRSDMARAHREAELLHQRKVEELRARSELLADEKAQLSTEGRELQARLKVVEQELSSSRRELQAAREENTALDRTKHEQEKVLQANAVRLSTLEQQVEDGRAMAAQLDKLVESAHAQKSATEDSLRLMRENNARLEEKVRASGDEVTKANAYIDKIQREAQALRSKLKVKMAVIQQQDQVVQDKDDALHRRALEVKELQKVVSEREAEVKVVESRLAAAAAKNEEAERTLASNQQVITWLNKEVNEAQLAQRGAFSANTFRPALPSTFNASGLGATALSVSKLSMSGAHAHLPRDDESFSSYKALKASGFDPAISGGARPTPASSGTNPLRPTDVESPPHAQPVSMSLAARAAADSKLGLGHAAHLSESLTT